MDNNNYLDLPESQRARSIYRIIPVQRLFELFANRENVLVKPKKWEDPFENFILRSRLRLQTGEIAQFDFHDHFYGQCWTLHTASDAMWRIYSPNKDAVRIRSTVRKLGESLGVTLGEFAGIQAYIGKVNYLPDKRLLEYASNWFTGTHNLSSRVSAQTLLVKRPAFRHEREIRLLHFQHNAELAHNDLFQYSINPHHLIDQIMIDPRMSVNAAKDLKEKIRQKTGYVGKILRSLLYSPPPELILQLGKQPKKTHNR